MSVTGDTNYPSTTSKYTSATATGDPSLHTAGRRSFSTGLSATLCVLFLSIVFACCVSYRLRREEMRRVVVSEFEEVCFPLYHLEVGLNSGQKGLFEGGSVRQRVVQLRRAAPIHPVITPSNHKRLKPRVFEPYSPKPHIDYEVVNKPSLPSESRLFALVSLESIRSPLF